MRDDLPLAGRIAVVTGAQGRLGPVWVATLAQAGATVVGVDVRLGDAGAAASAAVRHEQGDVVHKPSLERIRERIQERLGTPTILVNNAGIDQPPSAAVTTYRVEDISPEAFRETLDVNLVGTFNAIAVFGPPMAAEGRGAIVNIGSLYASVAPDPSFYDHLPVDPPFLKPPAYGASKAGVIQLTRYFARLWGPQGVRVNALSPGGVRDDQDPEFVQKYCARVPLGRMAEPTDLAQPLLFLASDASGYLTGQELRVDGGFTA